MKTIKLCITLAITILCFGVDAAKYSRSCGRPKTVSVSGYVKKNGTYVQPHRRAAPISHIPSSSRSYRIYHPTTSIGHLGFSMGEGGGEYSTPDEKPKNIVVDKTRRCEKCCGSGHVRRPTRQLLGAKTVCPACDGTGYRTKKK